MEVSDKTLREITKRVMTSRMRILVNNGFYGLLLMHLKISVSTKHETAWTDGKERIWLNPTFVDEISDQELDFVLMHEIMHAALQHTFRKGDYKAEIFNVAADIVVNSNIYHSNNDNADFVSLDKFGGIQLHVAPNDSEGYIYTVEEVYLMLLKKSEMGEFDYREYQGWDYHEAMNDSYTETLHESLEWQGYIRQACEAISIRNPQKTRGQLPAFAERFLLELKKPQIDWRQLLTEFIQDEVNDYSFMPPDRRLDDSPFYLPDYNERDDKPGKVLFAIDTSGSMSDEEIIACYSEIAGAIAQYNGRLEGYLCFFDARLTAPVAFYEIDDLLAIKPVGGGGTSFDVVFNYLEDVSEENLPQSIVILTDGCAPFPREERAKGIPVLWVIDNEEIEVPWGKEARIKIS